MQDRKQHPLESKLLNIIQLKANDMEKCLKLKACLAEIKECQDTPSPSIDTEDPTTDEHDSPLHWAAYYGNTLCLDALINAKANIDKQNALGDTALHWAFFNQDYDSAKLLIAARANPNTLSQRQHTPLDDLFTNDARKLKSLEFIGRFVEMGGMPHTKLDDLIELIINSDLNNRYGYVILSLLSYHHREQQEKSLLSESQFNQVTELLEKALVPPSVNLISKQLSDDIDYGVDEKRQYPSVLLSLIQSYDNPFDHHFSFFHTMKKKDTTDSKEAVSENLPTKTI